jgi:hypothetical protein
MRAKSTTFPIAKWTQLEIEVVIHPDLAALRRACRQSEKGEPDNTLAFCQYNPQGVQGNKVATLHFCPEYLDFATIAHETLHAVLLLGRAVRIDLENLGGEELLAESVEQIVNGVLALKKKAASKRPSKKRPPCCDPSPA